jgi:hypothetical protein
MLLEVIHEKGLNKSSLNVNIQIIVLKINPVIGSTQSSKGTSSLQAIQVTTVTRSFTTLFKRI